MSKAFPDLDRCVVKYVFSASMLCFGTIALVAYAQNPAVNVSIDVGATAIR